MIAADAATEAGEVRGRSLWQDSWARLRRNRMAVLCMVLLGLIISFCTIGSLPVFCHWSPHVNNLKLKASAPGTVEILDRETWLRHKYDDLSDPDEMKRFQKALESGEGPESITLRHWFGTDALGRDLLARTMQGGRVSLMVGFVATLVALLIGVSYGAVAGYFGGRVDDAMMRAVDVLRALPFMIFVILLVAMFGKDLLLIFLAIGAVEWLTMARIVRAQVLGLARQEFVDAARSLGLPAWRIIFRHIIPNVLGPVIVYATLTVPAVMLLEAALSFLGLGVQPPGSSWGRADQRRRAEHGKPVVAPRFSGGVLQRHALLPQLQRRRPARCSGCAGQQGLRISPTPGVTSPVPCLFPQFRSKNFPFARLVSVCSTSPP